MKLANERGEELSLADLDQIRGGAGLRSFRSEVELARLGRGLQRHATGLLEPLDLLMGGGAARDRALAEPPEPEQDQAFEVDDPGQYLELLQAR